jgi:hypothetical protein
VSQPNDSETAVMIVMLLSTGQVVRVLVEGETVGSLRARIVLLCPDRASSRTVQHVSLRAVNRMLMSSPSVSIEGVWVDYVLPTGRRGRASLTAHKRIEG